MVSLALKISDEFKEVLNKLPWVNWSEVARQECLDSIKGKQLSERFEKIVLKSRLTEKGAMELARKVNEGMYKRLKKLHPELP